MRHLISNVWQRLPWRALARWWAVGIAFLVIGLGMLYVLRDLLKLPLLACTLITAESTTIIRYFINDLWVFKERRLSLVRLWQFHVANIAGFVIWSAVVNVLPRFGVHYLIASAAGTACSVVSSMATNFLWIWGKRAKGASEHAPQSADAVPEVTDAG